MKEQDMEPIVPITGTPMRYHPLRFRELRDAWGGRFEDIDVASGSLLGLEAEALQDGRPMRLSETVDVILAAGELIDASSLDVLRLSLVSPMILADAPLWAGAKRVYVHLGGHAFPSLYFKAGIEGVYLDADMPVDGRMTLRAILVVSPEFAPAGFPMAPPFEDGMLNLVESMRHVEIRAVATPGGIGIGTARPGDDIADWMNFLGRPMAAALNAFALALRRDQVVLGLEEELIEDALTESRDALPTYAARRGSVLMNFLGGVPEAADIGMHHMPTGAHAPRPTATVKRDVGAFLEKARRAWHPGARLHHAGAAKELLAVAIGTGSAADIDGGTIGRLREAIEQQLLDADRDLLVRTIEEDR